MKRLIAILVLVSLISTVATTSAVSAAGKSDIRFFDIKLGYYDNDENIVWVPYGKLTINVATGHVIVNVNYAKLQELYEHFYGKGEKIKNYVKEDYRQDPGSFIVSIWNYDKDEGVPLGTFATTINGGTIHGEGTAYGFALPLIAAWSANDYVLVHLWRYDLP